VPSLAFADFTGPIISVLDGATLEALHNHRPERIRLSGIDCPERGQDYGTRAKQAAFLYKKKGRPDQVDPFFTDLYCD
jgi:micrococcal nuclease